MNDTGNIEAVSSSPFKGLGGVRFLIAGGGTGGHIFPAIAIANAIRQQQPDLEILFVGANGKMEMEKVPQAGYNIKGIDIAGFNRSSLIKNILLPLKLLKSFRQAKEIINEFKPDAAIGVGGYSSYPVLRYAQRKKIPTFIHESNSFAGKSNKMLSKRATKIFVAAEGMEKFFPANKIIITGNPIRRSIAEAQIPREEALKFFGLDTERKTVLIVGGSLGARSINEVIVSRLQQFQQLDIQLIWQTGKTTGDAYIEKAEPWSHVWAGTFITEMEKAYAAADVVISRAGAMAVAELCVTKKPVVFVPYPFAAEDHQTANAKYLVEKNAALMVPDKKVEVKLFPTVVDLVKNEKLQETLKENIGALTITNADEKISSEVLNHLNI